MSWTDERVELLKKLWMEGQSASQIAKQLGGVTRNAVIGKVHRLGLSNRNTPEAEAASAAPGTAQPRVETRSEKPAEVKPKAAEAPATAPVVDLAEAKAKRESRAEAAPQPSTTTSTTPESEQPVAYTPRPIIPAGQPLPPQPSTDEIDPEALATVREVEKTARKLSLMELTERTCKWPIGDPATEEFWFCGLPVKPGKPYCEAHVAVAFQPMSSRRDRKR
ncbi:MAG: GcrA cell cycle regulator [Rhodobacteraceae bacterium]|nr:GcrA cell cycle regulator [Paracoccaceae bacterium]